MCLSHKIVIHRVLLRGADREGLTMVCYGPHGCLADSMLRNYYQTWSKTAKKRHKPHMKGKVKQTEESVTTFHLGLPPAHNCDKS